METLVAIGIVVGAILMLCLFAFIIRKGMVWVALRKGYTADTMPIHYHILGFATYISALWLIHIAWLLFSR